jgi:hypothetical protein
MAGRRETARENGKKGGRPKGSKDPHTLTKELQREALRAHVAPHIPSMTDAQIEAAKGIKHLMLRDPKTGKFERVKDEDGIDKALKSEGEAVWIYTKDPSTAAYTDVMNRTLDKPAEQDQTVNVNVRLGERIKQAEARLIGKR